MSERWRVEQDHGWGKGSETTVKADSLEELVEKLKEKTGDNK